MVICLMESSIGYSLIRNYHIMFCIFVYINLNSGQFFDGQYVRYNEFRLRGSFNEYHYKRFFLYERIDEDHRPGNIRQ